MQPPPPQAPPPMGGPGPYGASEKFQADTVMGIILIILAAIGGCLALMAAGIGGLAGAAGAAGATGTAGTTGANAGAVAAAGGILLVFGIIMLVVCIIDIVGGVWMMKSLRKGFMLVLVVGAIGLLLSILGAVTGGHFNFFGFGMGLIFPGYSAARLFGNFGPRPLES